MASKVDRLIALLKDGKSPALRLEAAYALGEVARHTPADSPALLRKVHVVLISTNWDARVAAGVALEAIAETPAGEHSIAAAMQELVATGLLTFANCDLARVIDNGAALLATGPQQFNVEPVLDHAERLITQRRLVAQRIGLAADDDDVRAAATATSDDLGGLVSQQDLSAAFIPSAHCNSTTPRTHAAELLNAFRYAGAGTIVAQDSGSTFKHLFDELLFEAFHPQWTVRHGALVGLREVLKVVGCTTWSDARVTQHAQACTLDAALRCIAVLVLDRFGDFTAANLVAPVRATAAQALAAACAGLRDSEAIVQLARLLLSQVDRPVWFIRHGVALGLLAVLKASPRSMTAALLQATIFPALQTLLADDVDDVRAVAAQCMDACLKCALPPMPASLVAALWRAVRACDDLSGSAVYLLPVLPTVLQLVGTLRAGHGVSLATCLGLVQFLGHPSQPVRRAAAVCLDALLPHVLATTTLPPRAAAKFRTLLLHVLLHAEVAQVLPGAEQTHAQYVGTPLMMPQSIAELLNTVDSQDVAKTWTAVSAAPPDQLVPTELITSFDQLFAAAPAAHAPLTVNGCHIPPLLAGPSLQVAVAHVQSQVLRQLPRSFAAGSSVTHVLGTLAIYEALARRRVGTPGAWATVCAAVAPMLQPSWDAAVTRLSEPAEMAAEVQHSVDAFIQAFKANGIVMKRSQAQTADMVTQAQELIDLFPAAVSGLPAHGVKARACETAFTALKMKLLAYQNRLRLAVLRTRCLAACVLVRVHHIPEPVSSVIVPLMNSIKAEPVLEWQSLAATCAVSLMQWCHGHAKVKAASKMLRNVCIDAAAEHLPLVAKGAGLVLAEAAVAFGASLFTAFHDPPTVSLTCLFAFPDESKLHDPETLPGLSALLCVVPTLHASLHQQVVAQLPGLVRLLCAAADIDPTQQQIAGKAQQVIGAVCALTPATAVPALVHAVVTAVEARLEAHSNIRCARLLQHITVSCSMHVLPFVSYLLVPLLRLLVHQQVGVRAAAAGAFASLIRLIPVERGVDGAVDGIAAVPEALTAQVASAQEFLQAFIQGPASLRGVAVATHLSEALQGVQLRPYQAEGVAWLAFLRKAGLNGLLGDDMGLGKTLQALSAIVQAGKEQERQLPSLVVCPTTLVQHWVNEARRYFGPACKAAAYPGSALDDPSIHVFVTSYGHARRDSSHLCTTQWLYIVLDEGHAICNPASATARAVKALSGIFRLILTGTPVQNHICDLWSLFDFLMPGYLGDKASFTAHTATVIAQARKPNATPAAHTRAQTVLEELHRQVLPFVLRRLKSQVLHDLPPKIIQDMVCELSPKQLELYAKLQSAPIWPQLAAFAGRKFSGPTGAEVKSAETLDSTTDVQNVLTAMQYLIALCDHPALVQSSDTDSGTLTSRKRSRAPDEHGLTDSCKLVALRELLLDCGLGSDMDGSAAPRAAGTDALAESLGMFGTDTSGDAAAGAGPTAPPSAAATHRLLSKTAGLMGVVSPHRVLIFSQLPRMLDLVETKLLCPCFPEVRYLRIDASVSAARRVLLADKFNTDTSFDVMLATTGVGGLGLNLTGADTVVFLDHSWNPFKDLQAMDRAHRLGQARTVNVYRLLAAGTIEETIMNLQKFKVFMAATVVSDDNTSLDRMDAHDAFATLENSAQAVAAAGGSDAATTGTGADPNEADEAADKELDEQYKDLDLDAFVAQLQQ